MASRDRHAIGAAVADYDFLDEIGRGASGVVWRARHRQLGREVAIKELVGASGDEQIERFRREARVLATLDHPHVVRVFDYRETQDARVLIMELLRGGSLEERLRSGLGLHATVAAGIAAARGVHHAHQHGILHRDVKPANLLFDEGGIVKVTDFGIAGLLVEIGDVRATVPGSFLGTPAFAAPEQLSAVFALDEQITTAADQYSLAATLYWAASGRLTHDATGGITALCERRRTIPAVPLRSVLPGVPQAIEAVIMRALERDRTARYESMAVFADELQAAAADEGMAVDEAPTIVSGVDRSPSARTPRRSHPTVGPLQLIGREADIEEVSVAIDSQRLVTIVAAGGVGKTSLARTVALRPALANQDGMWFVLLAATTDPADVPRAVARALAIRDEDAADPTAAVADLLADRTAVIVLDNCEHVADAAAELCETLLDRCPNVTIVATSRQPFGLAGEHVHRLAPLTVAPIGGGVVEIVDAPATRLFVDRARRQRPSFEVSPANAAAVATIVRRLDGIPLALELAAARLRSLSVQEVADRLDQRFQLLTTRDQFLEPRQRTLHQTIAWSFNLLDDDERDALCRISIFSAGFDLDAATAVLHNAGGIDEFRAVDVIDALVDKSLLQRTEDETGKSRYALLESVRAYAHDELIAQGSRAVLETSAAHLAHYGTLAQSEGPRLATDQQIETNKRLRADHDNIVAALVAASELPDAVDDGLRVACSLYYYWTRNGVASDMVPLVESLVERSCDSDLRADGHALLAQAHCALGQIDNAVTQADVAIALTANGASTPSRLRALRSKALATTYAAQFEAALGHIEVLLGEALRAGDPTIQAERDRCERSRSGRSAGQPRPDPNVGPSSTSTGRAGTCSALPQVLSTLPTTRSRPTTSTRSESVCRRLNRSPTCSTARY